MVTSDNDCGDVSDTESFLTYQTVEDDLQSTVDEGEEEEELADDIAVPSDHLSEYLDNCGHKNVSIRIAALNNTIRLLEKHYIANELEKWKVTALSVVEKALRKSDEEAIRAALLAASISLQLGEAISCEIEPVVAAMRPICTDVSRNVSLRVQCARSIAVCSFLSLEQPSSIAQSADALRSVWISSKSTSQYSSLFSATLSGWSLLVHQSDHESLKAALMDEPKLCTYVDATQVEIRMSAGEVLAVLHEAAVSAFGDTYHFPNEQHLLDMFAALSNDSMKFRGKKDRKMQRLTFRQMYSAIKDHQAPYTTVQFGDETLYIDSCAKKLLYEFMCGVLHSGTNIHLKLNVIVRDWFDLGPVIQNSIIKMTKPQRVAMQNAISKTRDLKRSKERDKRAVPLTD